MKMGKVEPGFSSFCRGLSLKKFSALSLCVLLLASTACHFERLDEAKKTRQQVRFDPQRYAEEFWHNRLLRSLDLWRHQSS